MKVFTKRGVYECASVEQYLDGHHLLNEDGSIYVKFPQFDFIERVEGGEIVVVEQPEPAPSNESVWDELDAAYQEGVNSAYDQ